MWTTENVMYEIDFLPVESDSGIGSKSGDAIAIRFTVEAEQRNAIVVIDGGFSHIGENLVEHIQNYFKTNYVDLVISTHPDADHLNGITTLLENSTVGELLVHQPRMHVSDVSDFSNLESLDKLISTAKSKRVSLTEPFTGLSRFHGQLEILGPTESYYESLVEQHLEEERSGFSRASQKSAIAKQVKDLLGRMLAHFPTETLTDDGDTGPRNNSSVITMIKSEGRRLLFTGDAGIPALEAACTKYESTTGDFSNYPLSFFQVPHHGSKRNLGPKLLDRLFGAPGSPYASNTPAFISSAKASEKHPSPKVVNSLSRRGCTVCATEGRTISHSQNAPSRPGWVSITPFGPLIEDDDD
jgi:beta-lactamase superfamily II metal-dependent hydrolase